ncbi:hypothetical protein [Candidatus Magnetomonas plexicatena]|uniref:hypothetical protein n=1 Tax=Candidatus Magnetomonas plexicatena TaxID=2552947 RepID=UPI0011049918|nr:hypothetical protein E2O03_001530 [Nitrospirales bacterium LBB_01]
MTIKEYIKALTKRGTELVKRKIPELKKHGKDIVILLALLSLIPVLVVKKPDISLTTAGHGEKNKYIDKKSLLKLVSNGIDKQYAGINDRNIFSQDGKYEALAQQKPTKIYTLVGIIKAKLSQVFLVDNLGGTYIVKQGDTLSDGTVVAGVDNISVVLKNGTEEKRLKILTVEKK